MPRILMVDDEVQVLHALRRLFRRDGFEVELAGGGAEALAKLEAFAPDVVLSDFRMPGMTGAELLAEVKRRRPLALRLVISGYADLDSVVASVNEGEACRFISKPWDDLALVRRVRGLLEDRSLLVDLHQAVGGAGAGVRIQAVQQDGAVEVRLECPETLDVERATALVVRFAGALAAQNQQLLSGLFARHGGRLTLVAEVGGSQQLSVAVPLPAARAAVALGEAS